MLRVIDFHTASLSPTKTYGKRSLCWIPADHEHPEWDRRLGNLTIKLQPARTGWGRCIEVDTYAVVEEPLVGVMGRKFLLLNLTDPEQPDVYETVIGPQPSCTCKAAKCKAESDKHIDALTYLVEAGILDEVPDYDAPGGDALRCGSAFPDEVGV